MKMLGLGKWIATSTSDGIAGFHLNELYSPWKTIVEVVVDYLEAKDDIELYKVFVNTSLGLPFEHKGGEQPEWKLLYERREERAEGQVPPEVLLLTCGVDVQKNRLEVSIIGWNRKRSWLIEHKRLIGDTSNEEVWDDLSELLDEEYDHPNGEKIPIRILGIDSGYQTAKVYEWVRKKSKRRVFALKGRDQLDTPVSAPSVIDVNFRGKKTRAGIKLWKVGVSGLKSELYGRLNLEKPTEKQLEVKGYPKSWIAFPQTDEEYFKQLTAETCIIEKLSSGHAKYRWKKTYAENHTLDCYIYAMAAYYVIGANKWKPEKWEELENYYAEASSDKILTS
ncbi:terminase gpA endonuclease subunit [Pseudobacteriovorax antillogorgiicola]|uniref:Phage terminase large subunit (GpA) n=2 Tax=Pseudobacteriovorax antillogorgiicola TaxID=1513793 RepID=A0A1Y6C0B5_9BACT|nr:phage terminase large subunit GpA [Pseudobacteriovorax antillogorgiicola]SMF35063.1 Phage terminase large subunit (GpA) [Pseudobacteriovorax antillogorgiicola]